jgi:hypothetical protein
MSTLQTHQKMSIAAMAVVACVALPPQAANVSRTDDTASKSRTSETFKAEKKTCASQSANAKLEFACAVS